MKNPTRTLKQINAAHTLTVISAGSAAALTAIKVTHIDFQQPATVGAFLALAGALAVGYLVFGVVDTLLVKVLRPYLVQLEDQIDAEQFAANQVPSESIAVAVSIQTFLADLRNGLPLAVEMAGPKGEMPQDGDEWIAYPSHPYRLEALTEWHTQRAA